MKHCIVCNKKLPTYKYKFCNNTCKSKYKVNKHNIPPNTRKKLFLRDKGICAYCQVYNKKWFANRIVKIHEGGNNSLTNLRTLCPDCHSIDIVNFLRNR
jgi:5-methylcytosine-specific restriction endonuclease McrA